MAKIIRSIKIISVVKSIYTEETTGRGLGAITTQSTNKLLLWSHILGEVVGDSVK